MTGYEECRHCTMYHRRGTVCPVDWRSRHRAALTESVGRAVRSDLERARSRIVSFGRPRKRK